MGHFYYVRHGQTVWNVENKICGATDIPLTPLGYEQARELGEEILRQGLKERSDIETVLLVAHNGIARAVHSYFYDMTNEEFAAFGMKNCQIRRYDF